MHPDSDAYRLSMEEPPEEEIPTIEDEFLKVPWLSRRFWIFSLVPLAAIGIAFYPPLAEVREQLIRSIAYIAVSLIAGFSVTHAAGRVEPAWKSRRFWVAVGSTVLDVVVSVCPSLASVRTELIDLIAFAGMALIGGFSLTDLALLKGWTTKR